MGVVWVPDFLHHRPGLAAWLHHTLAGCPRHLSQQKLVYIAVGFNLGRRIALADLLD